MYVVAEERRTSMAQLGVRTVDEMVGQVHKLDRMYLQEKSQDLQLDLSPILFQPKHEHPAQLFGSESQDHDLDQAIDFDIMAQAHMALFRKETTTLNYPIHNTDRAVGAILSNEISKIHGSRGLPADTLTVHFKGAAGQSFAAFATYGLTLQVDGNTNDYLAKGLCGGKVIIKVPKDCDLTAHENVITGNVTLYGATAGEVYINGKAGERFAVRNSGADAVVEGIDDHGYEYMTGGHVVVLGTVGRNFAAGMSGGLAFVHDPEQQLTDLCAPGALNLLPVDEPQAKKLKAMIQQNVRHTGSQLGQKLLKQWSQAKQEFVMVLPEAYRQALLKIAAENQLQEVS